ncbi:MAG: DUF2155 domain-containing protein, partial [Alphaproteobacteria bacterium]|nr:DUF2155 domain-containing protein [Alphaproteobacteria bacterium]
LAGLSVAPAGSGFAEDSPGPPSQGPTQPAPGPGWLPQGGAEVQVLDKVNARSERFTVRGGGSVRYGSITITIEACEVRPPNRPGEAAAYLVITDSHPASRGFRGWMLRDIPSASMMEHPIYDVRVLGCVS